jgi:nitrate reductase NapE component
MTELRQTICAFFWMTVLLAYSAGLVGGTAYLLWKFQIVEFAR